MAPERAGDGERRRRTASSRTQATGVARASSCASAATAPSRRRRRRGLRSAAPWRGCVQPGAVKSRECCELRQFLKVASRWRSARRCAKTATGSSQPTPDHASLASPRPQAADFQRSSLSTRQRRRFPAHHRAHVVERHRVGASRAQARRCLEGMPIGNLEARGRCCHRRPRALRALRAGARASAGVRRPAGRSGRALPPSARSSREQRLGLGPAQRERLLVHHRIGEPGCHQHVAEVVHVDEGRRRRGPAARRRYSSRSSRQRARAEAREHHEAVDREQAMPALRTAPADRRPRAASCWPRRVAPRPIVRVDRDLGRRAPAPRRARPPRPRRGGRDCARGAPDRVRRRGARLSDRRARSTSEPAPRRPTNRSPAPAAAGSIARRSPMRRATSPCSQGGARLPRQAAQAPPSSRSDRAAERQRASGCGHGRGSILSRCCHRSRGWSRGKSEGIRVRPACARSAAGWGAGRVCARLLDRFAPTRPRCDRCALAVPAGVRICGACLTDPPPFDRRVAAIDYGFPWDRADRRVQVPWRARPGRCARRSCWRDARTDGAATAPSLADAGAAAPCATARARLQPGLGTGASPRPTASACAADPDLLLRMRDTAAPAGRCRPSARLRNVRGAFAVEPRRRGELRGRARRARRRRDDHRRDRCRDRARRCERPARRASRSGSSRARRAPTPRADRDRPTSDVQHRPGRSPEIPPNTGNVIRLAANTGCALHLVEPLGFSMDDQLLRRAGLDYHEYADVRRHASWPRVRRGSPGRNRRAVRLHDARRPAASPMCAWQPATGSSSASETAGLPASRARGFDAGAARAPADAARPAQPEPEQRRRGRRCSKPGASTATPAA